MGIITVDTRGGERYPIVVDTPGDRAVLTRAEAVALAVRLLGAAVTNPLTDRVGSFIAFLAYAGTLVALLFFG